MWAGRAATDGGSAYTYTKTSYRWVGDTLVRQVSVDRGGFATVAEGPTGGHGGTQLPAEFTNRCGDGSW